MAEPRAEQVARLRLAARLLRVLAPIVPPHCRDEWLEEWRGELWHVAGDPAISRTRFYQILAGALPHALWLRRNEWRLAMLTQDLHFAWRGLRKRPGFAALVIAMLTLGIGAATTMFTVVNSVLLEPLPYAHPEQLVAVNSATERMLHLNVSPLDLIDYRAQTGRYLTLAGYGRGAPAILSGSGEAAQLSTMDVTANYFATLGVAPFLGRTFREDEERGADAVILSYRLWQSQFGGDRNIVGRTITLDGRPTDVLGVMSASLDRTLAVDLFRPFNLASPHSSVRAYHTLPVIGRLKPGVTIEQASQAMHIVATHLAEGYPEDAGVTVSLRPYQEVLTGGINRILLPLFGAVGLVLLIACGNAGSLLLGRAAGRQAEITTRIALGATASDLARLLLTESLLLSVSGGVLGVACAVASVRLIRGTSAALLPRFGELGVNVPVLTFATLIAVGAGLAFGAAPALHAVNRSFGRSPHDRHRVRTGTLRDAIVAGQVALSLVLLVGASLMLRSLAQLRAVDHGFQADGVITAAVALPIPRYTFPSQARFWDDALRNIRLLPGVRDAAGSIRIATATNGGDGPYWAEGHAPANDAGAMSQMAQRSVISDHYFATLKIPLLDGTTFDDPANQHDDGVIINQHMASHLFPGERAVGRHFIAAFGPPTALTVVGVVGDTRTATGPLDVMYFPAPQMFGFLGNLSLTVRSDGDPTALVPAIRSVIRRLDPELPLTDVQTMTAAIEQYFAVPRSITSALTAFALTALLLALIGVYAALAQIVALRTRELGLRAAVGAQRQQLFALVLRRGMMVIMIGIAIGTMGAFATTRLIQSWLFHVQPTDPRIFGATVVAVAAAGLLACLLPARRATRIDPNAALRAE
jgi:putative ABC transport system permease protein